MKSYSCKCGKSYIYGSNGPGRDCEGCDECNTQYGAYSDGHHERQPHDWRNVFNRYTGELEDKECKKCFESYNDELKRKEDREKRKEEERKEAEIPLAYKMYSEAVKESLKEFKNMPHCDSNILHKLGECKYCDERPDLHEARKTLNIAYTGHPVEGMLLCPAEARRSLENINKWYGNVPYEEENK